MPTRRGAAIAAIGIAAIFLLALLVAVPGLRKLDRYRPQAISYLQEQTGKPVDIGRLSLTFLPLTIHVDHFGVKNPQPIFQKGYVLEVARIDAERGVGAILRGRVSIKSLVLEDPILNLTSDPDGPWNFENPQLN